MDLVSSISDDLKQRQFEQRACPPKAAISDVDPKRMLTEADENPESSTTPAVSDVVGATSVQDQ